MDDGQWDLNSSQICISVTLICSLPFEVTQDKFTHLFYMLIVHTFEHNFSELLFLLAFSPLPLLTLLSIMLKAFQLKCVFLCVNICICGVLENNSRRKDFLICESIHSCPCCLLTYLRLQSSLNTMALTFLSGESPL